MGRAKRFPVLRDTEGRLHRRFTIYPGGPRRQCTVVRTPLTANERSQKQSKLLGDMQTIMNKSISPTQVRKKRSSINKWKRFCNVVELDEEKFGSVLSNNPAEMQELITIEGEILSAFAAYSFSETTKAGRETVLKNTVDRDLNNVKEHLFSKWGRMPGHQQNGKMTMQLTMMLRGIERMQRPPEDPRLPILQQHLRAVKSKLDLKNSKAHRVLWALWLTQWQGSLRSSDLIRPENDVNRTWKPMWDSHRGRIRVEMLHNARGKQLGIALVLTLKPLKNDRHNTRIKKKEFLIDQRADALSAGTAIYEMIKVDEVTGDPRKVPLFRNPATGKEITYEQSRLNFNTVLKMAGLHNLASGVHCLRIGGTSALSNAEGGGEGLAIAYGGWKSNAAYNYVYLGKGQAAEATARMARQERSNILDNVGPISRAGGSRYNR